MSAADFQHWVAQNKASGATLTRADYLQLAQPSQRDPVRRYAAVAPDLFDAIVNRCVAPGSMCMNEMMAKDAEAQAHSAGWRQPDGGWAAAAFDRYLDAQRCKNGKAGAKPLPQVAEARP